MPVGAPGTLWVMGALARAAKGAHKGCPYRNPARCRVRA